MTDRRTNAEQATDGSQTASFPKAEIAYLADKQQFARTREVIELVLPTFGDDVIRPL